MNQFFYQITRKASEIVNSDDYRKRNITRKTAFTRNRKLTFPVMIVLILNFLTRTMQIELDDFFANVLDADLDSVTKKKYGKNAVMRGMNYQEGATAIERNGQVGGHKA